VNRRVTIETDAKYTWRALLLLRAPMFLMGAVVVSVIWGLALLAHPLS
jgi:hypothetical protein